MSIENHRTKSRGKWWETPALVGVLGLGLMLAGWKAMTYLPVSPREAEQERRLTELRDLAKKEDRHLAETIEHYQPMEHSPPYLVVGRLAFWGGLFLFVAAGILMYRHSPTEEDRPNELPEPDLSPNGDLKEG